MKKLLIVTQRVNRLDPVLGFFHSWIEEFSKYYEKITVICLEEGEHHLPENVMVLSLGKEGGRSRVKYVSRFYKYLWQERGNYNAVFVHMNQEYVILAGLWWRITGKKIFLWRNHRMGDWLTYVAVRLANRVFCTSPDSYTARFAKTKVMPTGINMAKFRVDRGLMREPRTILSMGRISKVKNVDLLVDALVMLDKEGVDFRASIVGNAVEGNEEYMENLLQISKELTDKGKIRFMEGISNTDTPDLYQSHELFVNMTISGAMDKTIFSAMASGALTIVCSTYFKDLLPENLIFREGDSGDLAKKIGSALDLPAQEKEMILKSMKKYVADNHSLEKLMQMFLIELK